MISDFIRSDRLGRLIAKIGAAGCFLPAVFMVAFLVLFLYHPKDDPKPTHLSRSEIIGAWKGMKGGRAVIRADGTFSVSDLCGFGYDESVGSGRGKWSVARSGDWGKGEGLLFTESAPENLEIGFGMSSYRHAPMLWRHIGDPDENKYCKIMKDSRNAG